MSTKAPKQAGLHVAPDARVAIVAARFNSEFVDALLDGCLKRLGELKVVQSRIELRHVPGAFELPLAAKSLAATKRFSAVICLGCVVRGETPHFDYVAGECARGIQQAALETMTPIIFGVLTTNTEAQARERLGGKHGHAGSRAADAAAEMIAFCKSIER